jgi:hypothetical protein
MPSKVLLIASSFEEISLVFPSQTELLPNCAVMDTM